MAIIASAAANHKVKSSPEGGSLTAIYLMATLVMLPALFLGAMREGMDSIFHARWMRYFAPQFWSGDFYPHWLIDMNGGFGSPAFFVYPPFTQFVTALLYPLFSDQHLAALLLGISVWLAMILSGIACFHWLRRALAGHAPAAATAAMVYMLAPYHLYLDVYQRGAVAEVWAFVWPPLTLMLLHRLDRFSPATLALLAFSIAGLLTTHAPSSLILVPAYFLYAALLDLQERRVARLLWLTMGCVLGCLLAGWYLGTALTHTRHINTASLFGGRYIATKWLIGGGRWPDAVIQPYIYMATGIQGGIGLAAGGFALWKAKPCNRTPALAAILLTALTLFMMSILSKPIWSLELPLNRIQFPWRFSVLLSLAGALAVAAACREAQATRKILAAVPLLLLVANLAFYVFPARYPTAPAEENAVPIDDSWDAPEYQLASRSAVNGVFENARIRLVDGAGTVAVTDWRPRSLMIDVDIARTSTIAIRQFDYPGWSLSSTSPRVEHPVLVRGKPYLQVVAPVGRYAIHLTLAETLPERIGRLASITGAIVASGLLLLGWFLPRRKSV